MRTYKLIHIYIENNIFRVVVQFDTGYYFTGTYDIYGLKLNQGFKTLDQNEAKENLISRYF